MDALIAEMNEVEVLAKELYYVYVNRDGSGFTPTKFKALPQPEKIAWYRTAEFVIKRGQRYEEADHK